VKKAPTIATCRSREGLAVGVCGGKLSTLTLTAGTHLRQRLYCTKCGRPATARKES
jgi:hypothetical protein